MAYLEVYPNKKKFKENSKKFANENDDSENEDEGILEWDFNKLIKHGQTKEKIMTNLDKSFYNSLKSDKLGIDFFEKNFLGFAYLIPHPKDKNKNSEEEQFNQKKYFTSVFRNINIQGETLIPQDSRRSLYFLNDKLKNYFEPNEKKFKNINSLSVKGVKKETKVDFVRFLAILSQYSKDGNTNSLAQGYSNKREKYYEEFIYSVVNDEDNGMFKTFKEIYNNLDEFELRFKNLEKFIDNIEFPKKYTSIIDLDIFLFGLMYFIIFEDMPLNTVKITDLISDLTKKIHEFKDNDFHKKSPNSLVNLGDRVFASIEIYRKYV